MAGRANDGRERSRRQRRNVAATSVDRLWFIVEKEELVAFRRLMVSNCLASDYHLLFDVRGKGQPDFPGKQGLKKKNLKKLAYLPSFYLRQTATRRPFLRNGFSHTENSRFGH